MTEMEKAIGASGRNYHGYFFKFTSNLFSSQYLNQSASQHVASSNTQVLNGNYSCKMTASYPTGEAVLSTIAFDIDASYKNILVFFSVYVETVPTAGTIQIIADFGDGNPRIIDAQIEKAGQWLVQKNAIFSIPSGATSVTIKFSLSGVYRSSAEVVGYLDNVGVYLQEPPAAKQQQFTIFSDNNGVLTAHDLHTGQENWTFDTAYGFLTAKPTVVDEVAYFGDGETLCNLYALQARSGQKKWVKGLQGSIDATPEVVDDTVYITTSLGYLYAVDKATGTQQASYDILQLPSDTTARMYSNQLANNTILMTTQKGVYGFDLSSKTVTFKQPLDYAVDTVPLIHNGIAYYGDLQGYFYAVDFNTNQSRWRISLGAAIHSSPQMVGEYVLVGCDDGKLYVIDMETGNIAQTLSKPGNFVRSFKAASNRLYVAFNAIQAQVCAYEMQQPQTMAGKKKADPAKKPKSTKTTDLLGSGQFAELWCFNVSMGVERDPLVIGNLVCFASNDKHCYCLNADTGAQVWTDQTPIAGYTEPAFVPLIPPQPSARRYDQYCYLMSHNSFAYFANGWWLGNQELSLTQQLDYGVRGLMLDTHKVTVNGTDKIVLYHEISWSSFTWHYLEDAMNEIRIWLENNPTEVVTIQFQNRQQDPALTAATLAAAGVTNMIFDPTKTNTGPGGQSWGPVLSNGWPTIDWMVQNNKRLVLFAEKNYDGLPYVWNYTVETWYGAKSMNGNYAERDESASIPLSKNRSLYTVNLFPDLWYALPLNGHISYDSLNSFESLMARADVCKWNPRFSTDPSLGWKLHLPNFLAIDFVTRGADGGALRAVKEINALWANKS